MPKHKSDLPAYADYVPSDDGDDEGYPESEISHDTSRTK